MYSIIVTGVDNSQVQFDCNTVSESYDASTEKTSLCMNRTEQLDSLISSLVGMCSIQIKQVEITYGGKNISTFTNYKQLSRIAVEYPDNHPEDAHGTVIFVTDVFEK
jgi:hypothetical protein